MIDPSERTHWLDKKNLTEQDIRTKFITPEVLQVECYVRTQMREDVRLTDGRINVYGKLVNRRKGKRANNILEYKPNIPIAAIQVNDNKHAIGDVMQQSVYCAEMADVHFIFSSNGDGFVIHDKTGVDKTVLPQAIPQLSVSDDSHKLYTIAG